MMKPQYPAVIRYLDFQALLAWHSKTYYLSTSLEELSPYKKTRWDLPGSWTFSYDWTNWGVPNTKTVYSKKWESYNLGAF